MAVNPSTESRRFSLLADFLLSVTIAFPQSPMHRCFVRIRSRPWHSNNIAGSVIYKPAIYRQQLPEEHNKTKRARDEARVQLCKSCWLPRIARL